MQPRGNLGNFGSNGAALSVRHNADADGHNIDAGLFLQHKTQWPPLPQRPLEL